jgi:hypothetical protein
VDVLPKVNPLKRAFRGWHRTKVMFWVTSGQVADGTVAVWPVRDEADVIFVVDNRLDPWQAAREFERTFAENVQWTLQVNTRHSLVGAYARQAAVGQVAALAGLGEAPGVARIPSLAARVWRVVAEGLIQPWNANERFQVRERAKRLQGRFGGLPLANRTMLAIDQTVRLEERLATLEQAIDEYLRLRARHRLP